MGRIPWNLSPNKPFFCSVPKFLYPNLTFSVLLFPLSPLFSVLHVLFFERPYPRSIISWPLRYSKEDVHTFRDNVHNGRKRGICLSGSDFIISLKTLAIFFINVDYQDAWIPLNWSSSDEWSCSASDVCCSSLRFGWVVPSPWSFSFIATVDFFHSEYQRYVVMNCTFFVSFGIWEEECNQHFLYRDKNRRLWPDHLWVGQIIVKLIGAQWKATHPRIYEYHTSDLSIVKKNTKKQTKTRGRRRRRRGRGEKKRRGRKRKGERIETKLGGQGNRVGSGRTWGVNMMKICWKNFKILIKSLMVATPRYFSVLQLQFSVILRSYINSCLHGEVL